MYKCIYVYLWCSYFSGRDAILKCYGNKKQATRSNEYMHYMLPIIYFFQYRRKNVKEKHKKKNELRDSVYHSVLYTKTLI